MPESTWFALGRSRTLSNVHADPHTLSSTAKRCLSSSRIRLPRWTISHRTGCLSASHERRERCFAPSSATNTLKHDYPRSARFESQDASAFPDPLCAMEGNDVPQIPPNGRTQDVRSRDTSSEPAFDDARSASTDFAPCHLAREVFDLG